MIATIDNNTCTGCEECVITCPDVFDINLNTYMAEVKVSEVPADLTASVESVATSCPAGAIKLSA